MAASNGNAQVYNPSTGSWASYVAPTSAPAQGQSLAQIQAGQQAQANAPLSAPTSSQMGSTAQPTYQGQDGITYNQVTNQPVSQSPVMTANVSTPTSYGTNPAPAVYNASQATSYLGNVGTQIQNLNNDSQAQSQAVASNNANAQAAQQPAQTSTSQGNTSSTDDSTDPAAQLNDSINEILSNLGQSEGQLDNQLDNATTTDNNGNQVTYSQAEQENQLAEIQGYQQTTQQLQQIQSGTYPLSAPEQQLLSSTTSQFQQAIAAQQTANSAYAGQMAETMASLGINQSAPTEAIGNIQGAISSGQSKIAALDTQMAQSVANLQISFQTQDFNQVQSIWSDMSKQFSDRQTALADMQSQVAAQIQSQKTDLQQFATTALSAMNNSATFSAKEKQDAITNAFTQQQINETQKKDAEDYLVAQMNATKGVYSVTSDGQVFDSRTGQFVAQATNDAATDPSVIGNTGNPLVDANTMTTSSGIPYVNGTNLTGSQASAAQLTAAQNGIPYLGSAAAAGIQQASTVQDNLTTIQNQLKSLEATGATTRPVNSLLNDASTVTQANSVLGAYKTFSATAIPLLKALANGASGFRITQTELNNVMDNDLPSPNDTVDTANQKINNIETMLNNGERGIFGDATYDKYNPTAAGDDLNSYVTANPSAATQIQSLRQSNPGITPYQVLQVLGAPMGVGQSTTNADTSSTYTPPTNAFSGL